MKNFNMTLTEKLQKYKPYHQAKVISINILQVNQKQIMEQPTFTYYPLGKFFEKQTKTIKD